MLVLAWLVAPVCSLPQSFIFRLKAHPLMQEYRFAVGQYDYSDKIIRNAEQGYELVSRLTNKIFSFSVIFNAMITTQITEKIIANNSNHPSYYTSCQYVL